MSLLTVDDVPVLLAPAYGELAAGLVFRVGRADETLPGSGVTRLVQRLALPPGADPDQPLDATFTEFRTTGSAADVVAFLRAVCTALSELPLDRFGAVRAALVAEAARRIPADTADLPMFRHGACGYGLLSYPEWGLHQLADTDAEDWAYRYFTRDNAVLWLTADALPDGLHLPLPPGLRRPVSSPASALPVTPAYFAGDDDAVAIDTVVPPGPATDVYVALLERSLRRELLTEFGGEGPFAESVAARVDTRGDGHALVTAIAHPRPGQPGAVLGGMLDVLTRLKVGGFDGAELLAARSGHEERLYQPGFAADRLPASARNLLTGQPERSQEQLQDELRTITPEDVRIVALHAVSSALLMAPAGHHVDWAGFAPAPLYSRAGVSGARYPSREIAGVTLVIGPRGVCLETPEGPVTVRFEQCVAVLGWPDGARHLIGSDGIAVRIEPSVYPVDGQALAAIDAAAPPGTAVWLPPRPAPDQAPAAVADGVPAVVVGGGAPVAGGVPAVVAGGGPMATAGGQALSGPAGGVSQTASAGPAGVGWGSAGVGGEPGGVSPAGSASAGVGWGSAGSPPTGAYTAGAPPVMPGPSAAAPGVGGVVPPGSFGAPSAVAGPPSALTPGGQAGAATTQAVGPQFGPGVPMPAPVPTASAAGRGGYLVVAIVAAVLLLAAIAAWLLVG